MGYSPPFLTSSGVFIGPSSTRSAGPPRVDFCLGVLIALSDPDLSLSHHQVSESDVATGDVRQVISCLLNGATMFIFNLLSSLFFLILRRG